MAGLWEFPGGKVEDGERPEDTLIRELREELAITVSEACLAPLAFASHTYPDFHLLMPLYVCRRWDGTVTPTEGQQLAWVKPNRLRDHEMPAGRCTAHFPPDDFALAKPRSGFSPAGSSVVPSASARRCAAEPGLSGFCWLS